VHPDYPDVPEVTVEELERLAAHPRVVAIGETGLDYLRIKDDCEWQRERFRRHIRRRARAGSRSSCTRARPRPIRSPSCARRVRTGSAA
jgi:Tat protein secretion system quality control protein TatD with DNase activity